MFLATLSQVFVAIMMVDPPTPIQIVEIENATITIPPELTKQVKLIGPVQTPNGRRIRLKVGEITIEASQLAVKEEGSISTIKLDKDGVMNVDKVILPGTPLEEKK